MAKEKTERQIDRANRFGKPAEWLGAAAVGLVTGAVTLFNLVSTKFHIDMSHDFGLLKRFQEENPDKALSTIFDKVYEKNKYLLNVSESEARDAVKSDAFQKAAKKFITDLGEAKADYRKLTKAIAQRVLGIESEGFKGITKGTWQRLLTFSPTSRFNMIFKGLFAVGAGTGVTLMAFNQLNTRDKLNELTKGQHDTDGKLDTLIDRQMSIGHAIQKDEPLFGKTLHDPDAKGTLASRHPMSKADALLAERAESELSAGEGQAL